MEHRLYFLFGDLLATAVTGAAAAWIVQTAMPSGMFLPLAMLVGMVLGMLVGAAFGTLFGPFFGAFEVALPTALAGMMAGMMAPMLKGMAGGAVAALWTGAITGLACLAFTYILQALMRGEAR